MMSLRVIVLLLALALATPASVWAFGGNVNQGSSSKSIPQLTKEQARILGKIGQGALVKQVKKAKSAKEAKALIAKAVKLIKDHEAKTKAQIKAKGATKPKKRAFGK